MACASSCRTKDHATYGECLRSKGVAVYGLESTGNDFTKQKKWDAELNAYAAARKEGLQPATTERKDIEAAKKAADQAGKPVALTALPRPKE